MVGYSPPDAHALPESSAAAYADFDGGVLRFDKRVHDADKNDKADDNGTPVTKLWIISAFEQLG